MGGLREELEALEVETYDHKAFVPYNRLEEFMTKLRITQVLQQCELEFYQIGEVVEAVLNSGIRLLAILISIRDVKSITRFLKADHFSGGYFDSKLPLDEAHLTTFIPSFAARQKFYRIQWKFIAPVFRADQSHRELDDRTILPFLSCKPVLSGGFGNVFRVTVEASHQQIVKTQAELHIICKQIMRTKDESTLEDDFRHELHIMSSLRCLNHANIIKLITAYTKAQTYNFLLPLADGDLKDLLTSEQRPVDFQNNDQIYGSLWGLSSALEAVHNYFVEDFNLRQIGCHYDIKPRNILLLGGKLVLSDFGLSRLRPEHDGSRSLFKQGEGCYLAPECEPSDQDFTPGRVGRPSDVWSFGCVLSEILAYLSGSPTEGPSRVTEFYNARKIKQGFFTSHHFHGVDGVNPTVVTFLDRWAMDLEATECFRSLAHLVKDILRFEPERRPGAGEVTTRLFHLCQKSIFTAMCAGLEGLAVGDFELEIEFHRLSVWGDAIGLTSESHQIAPTAWLFDPHSQNDYQFLQDILHQSWEEVMFIKNQKDNQKGHPMRPSYPLYYHLSRLQDKLWGILPSPIHRKMTSRLEEILVCNDSIACLCKAESVVDLQIARTQGFGEAPFTKKFDHRRIILIQLMREISAAIERQQQSDQDLRIDPSHFERPFVPFHHHYLTSISGRRQKLLIERMKYGEDWISRVPDLLGRINTIASFRSRGIIQDALPVLKCAGWYHTASQLEFGIVYELPQDEKGLNPLNLLDIIKKTQPRPQQPSLSAKFELASQLTFHILSFHTSGWLHKNICALNIIFFPDADDHLATSISKPYFIGFNYSRLNDESAFSRGPGKERDLLDYQHPAFLDDSKKYSDDPQRPVQRFQQEFDYYSAGLVLLEIALWKPLKHVTKDIRGAPAKVLEELLRTHIWMIKTYMGDAYGEAVKYCLSMEFKDGRTPQQVRDDFDRRVVTPISQRLL